MLIIFSMNSIHIGTELKKAREKKRLSQQEVADLLNISQKTISNIESDKSIPTLLQLFYFVKHYELNINYVWDMICRNIDNINLKTHKGPAYQLHKIEKEMLERIISNQNSQIDMLKSNNNRLVEQAKSLKNIQEFIKIK